MNTNRPPSLESPFGWPKPARIEEFRKLLLVGDQPTERVIFKGKMMDIPIIRVPIELPKYRISNGRTASLQSEYLALHPNARRDIFSGDPELWDCQETQHSLLLELAKDGGMRHRFEDEETKQVEPILLDENGFVVNGNRRLALWRDLLGRDSSRYGHFRWLDVAVLPPGDEKEIDRLEASLQIEKDIKAEYVWHSVANMLLLKQRKDGLSARELGSMYKMKEGEVLELLDMLSYAAEFLKQQGKADMWSYVSEDEFAFRKIATLRPRISGAGKQELFRQAAFILIADNGGIAGRLYDTIPEILENIDNIRDELRENFPMPTSTPPPALGELFGTPFDLVDGEDIKLAEEIHRQENIAKAREIIAETIETSRHLRRDAKNANYLLHQCAKAQASLAAAVKDGLREGANLEGVARQLDQIEGHLAPIRAYITEHAKS
jgi:hypothetical protein